MWIEPQKKKVDGKEVITGYKYVERYLDKKTGKYRKTSTTLNANSPQAKKKATQILNKRIAELNGKVVEAKGVTFEMAYNAYYNLSRYVGLMQLLSQRKVLTVITLNLMILESIC